MEQEAQAAPAPAAEEGVAELERNAVDVGAEQVAQVDVDPAHEGQRHQEVLAELPVGHPGRALLPRLEGERVDEDRPAALELDVVGAGVAQGHAPAERALLQLEGEQRRVPELPERPLVWVGDEVDGLGPEHGRRVRAGGEVQGDGLVGHQQPLAGQLVVQPRAGDGLEFVLEDPVDLAIEDARAGIDEPAGVAKGAA